MVLNQIKFLYEPLFDGQFYLKVKAKIPTSCSETILTHDRDAIFLELLPSIYEIFFFENDEQTKTRGIRVDGH